MNKKIIAILVLIAILFVSTISGTIFYYNGEIANQNSQISNLRGQLTNVTAQLTNLTGQVTNLNSANQVTALEITEIPYNYIFNGTYAGNSTDNANAALNYLYITGTVTNTGRGTAFNAGLFVVAYDATGALEINMTVPLGVGAYGNGVDNSTNRLETRMFGSFGNMIEGTSAPVTTLVSEQKALTIITIYHEGSPTNWNVTPVWTNSP
jgi:hypothetical protein